MDGRNELRPHTTTDALVAELRSEAADYDGTAGQYLADLFRRAADRIEELEADRG